MINEYNVKKYCCEDISNIENYEEAVNSSEMWDCHHKFELKCPLYKPSRQDLIDWNLYYNRPADELIFLTKAEHARLHNKGKKMPPRSEEHKRKMSEAQKGNDIICIETGEVHHYSAWRNLGYTNVLYVAKGKRKTCKGLHFEYAE